jgi:hypothetical protein
MRLVTHVDLKNLSQDLKIRFDHKSNLTSVISNFANCDILASYASHPNAMAYDNAEGRAPPKSMIAAASAAPPVLLSPASNKIKVIIVAPALPPRETVPPNAARTKKERKRPLPWLLLRPQLTMCQLQCHRPLSPPLQRRASQSARRSPPSPWTFGRCQCGCRQPTSRSIMSLRLHTSKNGLLAMLKQPQATSPTRPCPIINCTRKGLFGKRIVLGILEYMDLPPLYAFVHMMPLA